jgi:hypothetical protein
MAWKTPQQLPAPSGSTLQTERKMSEGGTHMFSAYALAVLAVLPGNGIFASSVQQDRKEQTIDMDTYIVSAPPGKGWKVESDTAEGAVRFSKEKPLTLVQVSYNWVVKEEWLQRGEEEIANEYRDEEVVYMTQVGVLQGSYELEDVKRDTTTVDGKKLYTLSYTTMGGKWFGKDKVQKATLYLYFPPDFAEEHIFYLFLISVTGKRDSHKEADFAPIYHVINSFRLQPAPPEGQVAPPHRRLQLADQMPDHPAGVDAVVPPGDLVLFYPTAAALTTRMRFLTRAGKTLNSFSPDVGARTGARPDLAGYRIECSVPIGSKGSWHYFTLATPEDGATALFVLTGRKRPVTDLEKVISFYGWPTRSLSWGFLYDRNADGWVDYLTLLDGALPLKTDEIAHLVPRRPGVKRNDPITIESKEELDLMLKHFRLVFTHHADDNFDGRSDGVVAPLLDPDNPIWVYGNGVLRSRAFAQVVDEDWSFVTDIGTPAGRVPKTEEGFQVSSFSGPSPLEGSSQLLQAVNEGIRVCRIPKGALPRQ